MKTKYFYLAALASLTLASCSSDDFIAEAPPVEVENTDQAPILFTSNQKAFTRADFVGADAAKLLDNKFVVTGFKGNSDNNQNTATPGSIVFDNYFVEYTPNTAHTTESNSNNWEYVGKTPIYWATQNGITQQTIKYWDYSATQYDFFAWSTGTKTAIYQEETWTENETQKTGVPAGKVLVSNIQPNTNDQTWTAAGTGTDADPANLAYTFTGTSDDLSQCYISDIVTVYKKDKEESDGTNNVVWKGYQKPVTLKFRQLGTKVRIGIYETIPGYSVKNVQFYTKDGKLDADESDATKVKEGQIVNNAIIFSAGADIYKEGTYKVYFPTMDAPTLADNNQAHIKFVPTADKQTTIVNWGGMDYTYKESGEKDNGAVYLGRTSNTATFANKAKRDQNYYEIYLPNENGANLNLRVNYTLESIDGSGEIIEVKNAKAQVPSIYTKWQPGYAYTYLFKISDNTNGWTGVFNPLQDENATVNSDPVGLYPITFDAVIVNAEDMNQETITTVSTPSITTYQKGSTVVNDNEYKAATGDIFVTVNENNEVQALQVTTEGDNPVTTLKAALYVITDGMTEAEVVDALTYRDNDFTPALTGGTIKGRKSTNVLTPATKVTSDATLTDGQWQLTNKVEYGVDGNVITVGDNKVLRFDPAAPENPATVKTYAFVYTTEESNATEHFEACPFNDFDANEDKYRYDYKPTVATPASTSYFDAQKGHVYFEKSGTQEPYTYTKVAEPFIGQGVSNLFLQSGTSPNFSYTKASGYAVSGAKYFYTLNGLDYFEAHNVTYGTTINNVLYVRDASETSGYKLTTDTTPQDGVAYYNRTGEGTDASPYVYTYCVFMPQQMNGKFELNTEADKVLAAEETPVDGQTYFDKYTKVEGKRYVKVIKVQ